MTNALKWVAVFFSLFIALLALSIIIDKDDAAVPEEKIEKFMEEEQRAGKNAEPVTGLTLIKKNGCASCHGDDLRGKEKLGPGLFAAKKHWDKDGLVNYLRNPSAFDSDSRFSEYRKQYGSAMMPSYENLDVKDLGKIADYILNLEVE
jgi:mono/diheme cytochrome c family protein